MPDYFGSKLSWTICLVVSIIYFLLFEAVANGVFDVGLLFGFCVWGKPNIPDEENGCYKQADNSHMYAFYIDALLTCLVVLLYLWNKQVDKLRHLAIGGIILAHGVLHFVLFRGINCYISPEDMPPKVEDVGYILFGIFTFALSVTILSFGFVENNNGWMGVILASAGVTTLVVALSKDTGSQWVLPALFAVSHPLSSVTGLFTKSPVFSSNMGWAFSVATITGILELTTCLTFYRGIGGHMWYDITLHIAVIMSLPPFAPVAAATKKKKT